MAGVLVLGVATDFRFLSRKSYYNSALEYLFETDISSR